MSDDRQSNPGTGKNWIERISQAFSDEPGTLQDIMDILRTAEHRRIIDTDSLSIIEGAIQVTDMQVREVMIPRSQMITVRSNQAPEEYIDSIIESAHSRFPVIGESTDDVKGILLAKDLLPLALKGTLKKGTISDLMRPETIVPESKRLNQLLKEFKQSRKHMAIVSDEYGGIAGLVTIEDILEQIVGEIEDEHDVDDEAMIKVLSEGEYNIKALMPIDEFNEYFSLKLPEHDFDTIGGLVLKQFERLPRRGDTLVFYGFNLTILNADNRKIRLIKLEKI